MSVTRRRFVEEARSWINTPFHHAGRCRAGVDCAGILVVTCAGLGLPHADRTGYSRYSAGTAMPDGLAEFCDRISLEEARLGDVLTFYRSKKGREEHLAIFVPPGSIVQAWTKGGVREVTLDERWRSRLVGAWHVRGVMD